ncbi:MAG TPA: hypothetical protein VH797_10435 [Nitrososphaeraceae archaeon]
MNHKGAPILIILSLLIIVGNCLNSFFVSAAELKDSGFWSDWCYMTAFPEDRPVCFQSHEECKKAESSDLFKSDDCFKHKS